MNGVAKSHATTATSKSEVLEAKVQSVDGSTAQGTVEPLKHDIFLAAQYGNWQRIEYLIKNDLAKATDRNEQGITPLHWAAINDRLLACKVLVDYGADVDAVGGDLNATPMMWAAKNGHVYIVHYLMTRGGNPALLDSQGYNVIQLATHSSNILLLIYLLHADLPVDSLDPQRHTCLMWATYQGDALSVDTLLKWGANVNAKDEDGLNALHWSVVRGNKQCIKRIIEEGGDLFAKQNEDKDARALATELKTIKAFESALASLGRDTETGLCRRHLLTTVRYSQWFFTNMLMLQSVSMKIIFLLPIVLLGLVFKLAAVAPIFITLPVASIMIYLCYVLNTSVVLPPALRSSGIHQTPYLAGIFFASAVWTALHWTATILPSIGREWPGLNLVFGIVFAICIYNFLRAMSIEPGYIPTTGGRAEQREAIEDLLRDGEFDNQHFCIYCLLRKPLRSKHCKLCRRCVAKHDHHCPWINNCVGIRNHRAFIRYIYALFVGIPLYAALTYLTVKAIGQPTNPVPCTLLSDSWCQWIQIDGFGILLASWDCLQMTWVTMLVIVQSWQIAKATTTQEVVNVRRHGYMGGAPDKRRTSVTAQVASVISGGTTDPQTSALDDHGHGPLVSSTNDPHAHAHPHGAATSSRGMMSMVTKLLGIDQFVDTAREGLASRRGRRRKRFINPFDGGVRSNCSDFWQSGQSGSSGDDAGEGSGKVKGQTVDFYRLYAMPATTEMYSSVATEEV